VGAAGSGAGGAGGAGGSGGAGAAGGGSDTCQQTIDNPSSDGCEFWAVDLDQQDGGGNDPASAPWGLVLSSVGKAAATVTIERNEAAPGQAPSTQVVETFTLQPGESQAVVMPTRELDCGVAPNDYASPGTCLSSKAFRITATSPISALQFNTAVNSFSNDASLLLPSSALGKAYRVVGWGAGHPVPLSFPGVGKIVDRAFVTIVGAHPGTLVKVRPSFRIKGNAPIAQTDAGQVIEVTLGPFDVLNLETDDATDAEAAGIAGPVADLTGTLIEASKPVAVFTGSESAEVPAKLPVPTPPGWTSDMTCCLDHLEEQLFPLEASGRQFVLAHSPIRSTGGGFVEADVLRFVGVAPSTQVTTSLPPPFDSFSLAAGEIKNAWATSDAVVSASEPLLVAQLLVGGQLVAGKSVGDPSLIVLPPVEQFRTRYAAPTPTSWPQQHLVLAVRPETQVQLDGVPLTGCSASPAGELGGVLYEARRCPVGEGYHTVTGDAPFGLAIYGYGESASYAHPGGALAAPIYTVPPQF
jgi:hypothetical protein